MKPPAAPPALETHRGEVVLRDIDHGYKRQFWLVPMSAGELEDWWRSQVAFDCDPDGVCDVLYALFGETPPTHSKVDIPGTFLEADPDLWVQMQKSGKHYSCVICCDGNSYLRHPDGSRIYHRGYTGKKAADV